MMPMSVWYALASLPSVAVLALMLWDRVRECRARRAMSAASLAYATTQRELAAAKEAGRAVVVLAERRAAR